MTENEISKIVIGCAIEVHKALGPGLLESAYEAALKHELELSGLFVKAQVPMPMKYKDITQNVGYRLDLLVEKKVIVEVKSMDNLAQVHFSQTLTYLRLSGLKLALLINFNNQVLRDGIHRIVNQL